MTNGQPHDIINISNEREVIFMKEFKITITVIGVLLVAWIIILINGIDSVYTMDGYIQDGYIVDVTGNVWEYDNPYKDGVEVEIIFNTNRTDERIDDAIYKIKLKK